MKKIIRISQNSAGNFKFEILDRETKIQTGDIEKYSLTGIVCGLENLNFSERAIIYGLAKAVMGFEG